ncbi:GYD domain-containing protein [Variovorax sp. CF079]|uniref:GYD domain-containing protein n=1 Tax=Variovorax sp. CF079 TaxID=1882774 RepID=UPI00088867DB|nr:GYD domain-containing protein [Variovorax sp. CF079]SDC27847.1 GYD domain-containing protein [Variovorax sp. CF079]
MPMFLHQWCYKDQQIRQMLDDVEEIDRAELVRTAIEAFGGAMHSFFYCFGEYDGAAISEFADETTALACVMSIYGQGRVFSVRTTPLFLPQNGMKAIRLAQTILKSDKARDSAAAPRSSNAATGH